MARVEGGAVIIDTDWPGLKNQIDTRGVNFRFTEDATAYQIFAIDGQYFYNTVIYKSGQAPQDQATYDTWRTEFETDYKNRTTDFSSTQPFYLSNTDGYSVVLKDGAPIGPGDGYGIALIGHDGSNYRMLRADVNGRLALNGLGVAGTQSGGVITIQGDPAGTPIPISGNITASNASVSDNDAAIPLFSNLIGGTDGTNLRPLRVFDVDTGGGQQWVLGVGLRKSSGGGSVEFGTSSDPIRIDPTGTTTQPVSGTVTANQGGAWAVAATQSGTWTVQPGNTANTTPWLTTINQGGNTATVSAAGALKIDGSAVTQPVSGTVTANAGTGNFTVVQSTASSLRAQTASESNTGSAIPAIASLTAGSDGTNLRSLFVDTSGRLIVIGAAATGAAVTGNPVLIAGSDGTNARSIRTATDGTIRIDPTGTTTQPVSGVGNFTVVGASADGATPSGNPLLIAGQDGTNVQSISTDGYGRIQVAITGTSSSQVEGRAADGATPIGNPVLIGGYDGTNVQTVLTDSIGRVIIAPSSAATPIAGFSFGDMSLTDTGNVALRKTALTEQTSNAQRSIVSSSANDTSAGTGARTVKITYYDSTGAGPSTENITMNGTTPVNTVSSTICYIEKIEVLTVGSTGSNVGTISFKAAIAGGGATIMSMSATDNQTFLALHYVPTGKTCFITSLNAGSDAAAIAQGGKFTIRAQDLSSAIAPNKQVSDFFMLFGQSSGVTRAYETPIQIIGPARIQVWINPFTDNTVLYTGGFDFYEQ